MEKQEKQETKSNENRYHISIKGISKQLSEINEKLSNVMMKNRNTSAAKYGNK